MIDRKRLTLNAYSSIGQIIIGGIVGLIIYWLLISNLGIETFGGWSLVLAVTSIAPLATTGLSSSIVKFIAQYRSRNELYQLSRLIETIVITVAILTGTILLFLFPAIQLFFQLIIGNTSSKMLLSIIPIIIISIWLLSISGVFHASLDGIERFDLRSIMISIGYFTYLILCFLLVPNFGVIGLGYAHILQSIFVTVGLWFLLRHQVKFLPMIPYHWKFNMITEVFKYGINLQINSISQILYDPITKTLIVRFGGISMLAYYELASWIVTQLRMILISANQVIVPFTAKLGEENPQKIRSIYIESFKIIAFMSILIYSLIITVSPIIIVLWTGPGEIVFVFFIILISIGYFINTLNAPAYFINMGTGTLFWNTTSHIAIGALNIFLGCGFGFLFGGFGVVIGWVISLIIGSSIISISFNLKNNISFTELLSKNDFLFIISCLIGFIFTFNLFNIYQSSINILILGGMLFLIYIIVVLIPIWIHPIRNRIFNLSKSLLF